MPIRASDGTSFPLDRVATILTERRQAEVHRANLQHAVGEARIVSRDLVLGPSRRAIGWRAGP